LAAFLFSLPVIQKWRENADAKRKNNIDLNVPKKRKHNVASVGASLSIRSAGKAPSATIVYFTTA
jgi:hypothetical protein